MLRRTSDDESSSAGQARGSLSGTPNHYGSAWQRGRPVLASAAPDPIQKLIRSQDWNGKLDELAQSVVETQLETHAQSKKDAETRVVRNDSLTDLAALKVIESFSSLDASDVADAIKALQSIPSSLARRTIWSAARLPYTALLAARGALGFSPHDHQLLEDTEDLIRTIDLDEWILRNERGLRDEAGSDWRRGLVAYSKHANIVFPNSTLDSPSRTLTRSSVSGYTFLDELKPETLRTQPSVEAFRKAFSLVTGGILEGLDWSHVFVAGGAALSSLCCIDPSDLDKYKTSDVDIYLYGLDPVAANKKIEEIFEVWKKNLPKEAKEEVLVVRNSRTITFFSRYPIKRVQIVLKLVSSLREVLLNFDLDQCAIGWDGSEVWLLPRAARALETGYTVFTMNMIEGHYLGERRATQEQRVFKYADKGYGIRILPSYLQKLDEMTSSFMKNPSSEDIEWYRRKPEFYNPRPLDVIAATASAWTKRVIQKYPFWPSVAGEPPKFTHAMLEERSTKSSEPGDRSCLVGFELLFRHVALWQEKVKGNIVLDNKEWATTEYDLSPGVPIGYDDIPAYEWNEKFTIEELKAQLQQFNGKEDDVFSDNLHAVRVALNDLIDFGSAVDDMGTHVRRVCFGPSVSSVLSNNLVIYVFIPPAFITYANALVKDVLVQHGLEAQIVLEEMISSQQEDYSRLVGAIEVIPARWKIGSMLTWQLLDRRIDEVFEIIWSFHRSHNQVIAEDTTRLHRLFTELSRRSIRRSPFDEFASFAMWASRKPIKWGYSYAVEQGFWGDINNSDDYEDEDEDEEPVDENLDPIPNV